MANLAELETQLLTDGCITEREVALIQAQVEANGQLDLDDVRFLVQLLSEAKEVCPAFDEYFFTTLKTIFLADGRIGQDEQYYLLKMLYADGVLRDNERVFLDDLRRQLVDASPEFEAMCETAALASSTNWQLGGN